MALVHVAFYPSDWLAGTRTLSPEETGIYITLVAHMYEMGGDIERNEKRLARLCGCKSVVSFKNALEVLIEEGKITEQDGQLSNVRVQKEIKKASSKSESAKRSVEQRWKKKDNKNNGGENTDVSKTYNSRNTNQNHNQNHIEKEQKSEPSDDDLFSAQSDHAEKGEIDLGFEEFWASWPSHKRKKGKADCLKVYRDACSGKHPKADKITPAQLNAAAQKYVASVRDLEYLKGTLPWLREPGWEPFVESTSVVHFRPYSEIGEHARALLEQGQCPPSMMKDGKPTAEAAHHLKRFGFKVAS